MRKQMYLSLIDRLREIKSEDGLPIIQHIDLWNENVSFIAEETFAMPAVFIEFAPIVWATLGGGVQQGKLEIRLHVVTSHDFPAAAGSPYLDRSLEFFDLLDLINGALFRLKGETFTDIVRVESL